MSDLVELCGGTVISDIKVKDHSYVTVLLPIYVTYIFVAAPIGWTSVEHRTEVELSFYYRTYLWKSGSNLDNSMKATLSIVRVGTDSSGQLFIEFKTKANFYGCFVMKHHTLSGIESRLSVPDGLNIKFSLELVWSEQTFDGPTQFWKATSNYNLKDYSGHYIVQLIPCEIVAIEKFSTFKSYEVLPCIALPPQKFDLPITFQQTLQPDPVYYSLKTYFQIFNNKDFFLLNPFASSPYFQYIEYKGTFSKGDIVYGRVFWSPEQELKSAYQLKIKDVILCANKNGYVPTFNVTGKDSQYGCRSENKNLEHKFILLDRHSNNAIHKTYYGLQFDAEFIEESEMYAALSDVHGVDGFLFKIDPLFKLSSPQWILQVTYSIKPTYSFRHPRSLENMKELLNMEKHHKDIKIISLELDQLIMIPEDSEPTNTKSTIIFEVHHIMYIASILIIILVIILLKYKRTVPSEHKSTKMSDKSNIWANVKRNGKKCYQLEHQQKKQTETCKIKAYVPQKEETSIAKKFLETEV